MYSNFRILRETYVDYKHLKSAQKDLYLLLNEAPTDPALHRRWIADTFSDILLNCLNITDANPGNKVQLEIVSPGSPERPLFITPRRGDQMNVETIFNGIEKILNSNEKFLLAGPLKVKFSVV